jgi:tRNA(fMet)-specific endonuclease VapC
VTYLLDTSSCIHFLNSTHQRLTERVLSFGPKALVVSAISVGELSYGAAHSGRPMVNAARIQIFLAEFQVEPFTPVHAEMFGRIKANLAKRGKIITDFDMAIAATALVLGISVVSADADFKRIEGLVVENWSR